MIPCDHSTGTTKCQNEGLMSIRASIPGRQTVQLHLCHSHQLADDNSLLILALCKLDRHPGTEPRWITPEDITINRLVQSKSSGGLARIVTISPDTVRLKTMSGSVYGMPKTVLMELNQLPGALEEPQEVIPAPAPNPAP